MMYKSGYLNNFIFYFGCIIKSLIIVICVNRLQNNSPKINVPNILRLSNYYRIILLLLFIVQMRQKHLLEVTFLQCFTRILHSDSCVKILFILWIHHTKMGL